MPIDDAVRPVAVPPRLGTVVDLAPERHRDRPVWLVLGADGAISRWDVATGEYAVIATTVAPEPDRKSWGGHHLRRRLHASSDGGFAAVVNDYGTGYGGWLCPDPPSPGSRSVPATSRG